MPSFKPAANVQAAAIAGIIVTTLEDVLSRHGITLSPDIANGLTAFAAVLVAHAWDVITGQNTPQPAQEQATQAVQPPK